jgi:hypothetical protein
LLLTKKTPPGQTGRGIRFLSDIHKHQLIIWGFGVDKQAIISASRRSPLLQSF